MALRYLLVLYCILSYVSAFSQVPDYSLRCYSRALKYKAGKDDIQAMKYMAYAISKYPAYAEAYSILGEWLVQERRYKEAIELFRAASASCPNGHKAFAKPLARTLLYNYDYREAIALANNYAPARGDKDWDEIRNKAIFMSQNLQQQQWHDTAVNMGLSINSKHPEFFPCMGADTAVFYFTRRVNGVDEDFFKATADSCGGWFYARNMGNPPNTLSQETSQMISADGHYLFITRCDNRSENGWSQGGCDLFMAYRADSIWSVPQSFGATINTPDYEGMACLSPDNRALYFVSDRAGGYGGMDIWVSYFQEGLWQLPRNLGPAVNTSGNETAPFLHADNKTLFFASDRHPGFGGIDLFYTQKVNDTTFKKPENLGYPFNTTANETSFFVTIDGQKAYFASDRDSVEGNFDIYEMMLPMQLRPMPIAMVKGYAYDSLTKGRLNYTSIYITDLQTDEQIYHFTSNRGDGSFMITLPVGRKYLYQADRIGYLDIADTIDLTNSINGQEIIENMSLLPQDYVKPLYDTLIAVVYFPINSTKLSDSDRIVIQEAVRPWMDKDMQLIINTYTDNTGTPLLNEQLSHMRAELVSKEVKDMGINTALIHANGWGEANPVADNDTEEGRSLNRRAEIIIRW